MPIRLALLFPLLAACAGDLPERDDTGDPPLPGDSGDTGDTGETDEHADWAIYELTVAGRTDGLDLDGDGDGDNALWVAGTVLDPVIAQALATSVYVPVVQLSGVGDWTSDDAVRLALFTGEDTDGDPADRTLDGETYAAGASVGDDGLARASTAATLTDATYAAAIGDGTLTIGELTLDSATDLLLTGSADPAATAGRIGLAIPIDDLLALAASLGLDTSEVDALAGLADLDTDADGDADAVSATFAFQGVRCQLAAE